MASIIEFHFTFSGVVTILMKRKRHFIINCICKSISATYFSLSIYIPYRKPFSSQSAQSYTGAESVLVQIYYHAQDFLIYRRKESLVYTFLNMLFFVVVFFF